MGLGYKYETSHPAWISVQDQLNEKQKDVYVCLCEHGPLTDKEISMKLSRDINTITPRRGELVEKGLVIESGIKRSFSGRMATLWKPLLAPLFDHEKNGQLKFI